ncbi:hypothetical protein PUN28_010886 [Cardiocondyla obscurior]|uniref:Uncharacterized protein n=1 Tax=Cardiocondyla obscurior TaxID=286306 RepID=A0AAW2FJQ7_9HYME
MRKHSFLQIARLQAELAALQSRQNENPVASTSTPVTFPQKQHIDSFYYIFKTDPALWFIQVKASMRNAVITKQITLYNRLFPRLSALPPSSIYGDPEPLYCYYPPTDQLDTINFSEQSTEPGSEQFRPTTDSISLPEVDFQDHSPSPDLSIEVLEKQQELREVVDPLLELLRRTSPSWTDPVPVEAFTIGPDHFDPEEIRGRQIALLLTQISLYTIRGVETSFLAPMDLIDLVFPRTTVRVCEIEKITLD